MGQLLFEHLFDHNPEIQIVETGKTPVQQ